MKYLVKGKFIEEFLAGEKRGDDTFVFVEQLIHPSLEMLEKQIQEKKIEGGLVAGVREGYFIVNVGSNEELAGWLRSFPFWGVLDWTVIPLQSPRSSVEQDKAAFQRAREMMKNM